MYKIICFIALCATGLNAQSKLFPNNDVLISLKQVIVENRLNLSDESHVITKVLFLNKETFRQDVYENESNSFEIDLATLTPGLYTVMAYLDGDIVVFRVEVRLGLKLKMKEFIKPKSNDNAVALVNPSTVDVKVKDKTVKYYKVISTVSHMYNKSEYNVFSEKRKNNIIRKNVFDLTSYTGKKNTLILYAVYLDGRQEIIYKTEKQKDTNFFNNERVVATVN